MVTGVVLEVGIQQFVTGPDHERGAELGGTAPGLVLNVASRHRPRSGDPLAGVWVEAYNNTLEQYVGSRTTNDDGFYEFSNLNSGCYEIQAYPPPDIDGTALYHDLRKTRGDLRVLFISGYASYEIADRDALSNPGAYLEKPFSRKTLLSRIRRILDRPPHDE